MGYKAAYQEVMRGYESARNQAEDLIVNRRKRLYADYPRIATIDQNLREIGLSLAKLALKNDEAGLQASRVKVEALEQEKVEIMEAAGIPADYLTAVYSCLVCNDTGYIHTLPGQLNQRCNCLKQRLVDVYYSLSNIKSVLNIENFDNFDFRVFSPHVDSAEGISQLSNMQLVYEITIGFVQDFSTKFNNLLLYGRTGLGKTFVCHCIAKDLLDAGRTVLYVTAPRLFKIIEDYRFNRESLQEPDEMLEAVEDVDLLILDDLGAEFTTIVTSSALFDIVNQRLLANKPTIISTNLSPPELARHYSERTVSRFTGYYQMIKFFGEDIRVKKKYGGRYEVSKN